MLRLFIGENMFAIKPAHGRKIQCHLTAAALSDIRAERNGHGERLRAMSDHPARFIKRQIFQLPPSDGPPAIASRDKNLRAFLTRRRASDRCHGHADNFIRALKEICKWFSHHSPHCKASTASKIRSGVAGVSRRGQHL